MSQYYLWRLVEFLVQHLLRHLVLILLKKDLSRLIIRCKHQLLEYLLQVISLGAGYHLNSSQLLLG